MRQVLAASRPFSWINTAYPFAAGYLLATLGPFTVGVLYDATGGWTAPLLLMTALVAPMVLLAGYVGRPLHVEDQLRQRVDA